MKKDKTSRTPVSQQPFEVEKPTDTNTIGGTVSIEINGEKMHVPLGTTILEACKEKKVHIPTLCHHPDLCVAGVCRICVVEVEGQRTLQPGRIEIRKFGCILSSKFQIGDNRGKPRGSSRKHCA